MTVNEVNSPPILPQLTNQTIIGTAMIVVTNTAADSDVPTNALTYALLAAPSNAVIDTNGVITWTPMSEQVPSTNVFTTVATDDNPSAINAQHLSATNTFTVFVLPIHNGPSLPAQADRVLDELTLLVVTNTAIDGDIPALQLTYQLLDPPAGAAIDTNGVITWMPSEAQGPGTNTIATIVTDNGQPPLSATNFFTVVIREVNSPPVLAVPTNQIISDMMTLNVSASATDSDIPTNTLIFSLVSAPEGMTINPNTGAMSWTPTPAQAPSTNTIAVAVTDDGMPKLSDTNSFVVTVIPAPLIEGIQVSNGVASVTCKTLAGLTYRLQYKDNLSETNWNDVVPDATATSSSTTITNDVSGLMKRFYRVLLLQ